VPKKVIIYFSMLRLPLFMGKWRKICVFPWCSWRWPKITAAVL